MSDWITPMGVFEWAFEGDLDDAVTAEKLVGFVEGATFVMGLMGCELVFKSYDPLSITENDKVAHTYMYDLLDGGRHHPYESLGELAETFVKEILFEVGKLAPRATENLLKALPEAAKRHYFKLPEPGDDSDEAWYFPHWVNKLESEKDGAK